MPAESAAALSRYGSSKMRRLVSSLIVLVLVALVPSVAAAGLVSAEGCCSMAGDSTLAATPCCAVNTCSMSRNEETRLPQQSRTEAPQKDQHKLPTLKVQKIERPATTLQQTATAAFAEVLNLPVVSAHERMTILSTFLI